MQSTKDKATALVCEAMGLLWGEDFVLAPSTCETPTRVVKAWIEMTTGQGEDPLAPLKKTFPCDYDEMVVLKSIPFVSICEHHLIPFVGEAHIAYIPKDSVVGLSKIPRMIDILSARTQIQEKLTQQIAETLEEALDPLGVGVVLKAEHGCMSCRGVGKAGIETITSCLRGAIKEKPEARAEFMRLSNAQ